MPEQRGTVISVSQGLAVIRLDSAAGCAACAGSGCRQVSLLGLFGRRCPTLSVPVPDAIPTEPGDRVRLEMSSADVSLLALAGYLLPLAAMASSAAVTSALGSGDGITAAAAALGLAGGLALSRMPALRRMPTLRPLN